MRTITISATLVSVITVLAVILLTAIVVAPLIQWIGGLLWEVAEASLPGAQDWWQNAIGPDPQKPEIWGRVLGEIAWPLGKWSLAILIVWGYTQFETFPIKSFEVTQLELLSSRLVTVGNGTGLNVSLKGPRGLIPIIVYHPDKLPIRARRTTVVVKATDRQSNPIFFDLLFVGKVLDPLAVYNFGGLDLLMSQVREMISGALNAFIVDKDGYTLETDATGRKTARLNREVYAEGRQAIEDILNGSGFFQIVNQTLPNGKTVKYYRYLIDGVVVYEFQEIQIADSRFSEAIAATLEKLQIEQIDASGESAKAEVQEKIMSMLRAQGVTGDLAGILAAKAMGNQPDGVVWTTADTLVTGSANPSVLVGKK